MCQLTVINTIVNICVSRTNRLRTTYAPSVEKAASSHNEARNSSVAIVIKDPNALNSCSVNKDNLAKIVVTIISEATEVLASAGPSDNVIKARIMENKEEIGDNGGTYGVEKRERRDLSAKLNLVSTKVEVMSNLINKIVKKVHLNESVSICNKSYANVVKAFQRPNADYESSECWKGDPKADLDNRNNVVSKQEAKAEDTYRKIKITKIPVEMPTRQLLDYFSDEIRSEGNNPPPRLIKRYSNGRDNEDTMIIETSNYPENKNMHFLDMGSVRLICYNYVGLKQCWNCQRPGHLKTNCTFSPRCKYCSGAHAHSECPDKTKLKCVWCQSESTHTSNYEGCPARLSYISEKTNPERPSPMKK